MPLDQKAVVQELYSRIGTLPPDKAAIVHELAGRFGLEQSGPPDAGAQMRQSALGNTREFMSLDDESTPDAAQSFKNQLQAVNPIHLARAYVDHMNHPFETATGLPGGGIEDVPGVAPGVTAGVQASNGNVRGAFGTAAGAVTDAAILAGAGKIAGMATRDPVQGPAPKPEANSSILATIKTIANHPEAPAIAKDALKLAGGYRLAKVWDIVDKFLSKQKETPAPAPAPAPGKASTDMPVGTQTNGTVSIGAASSAMGTETPRSGFGFSGTTAPGSPFFAAAQTLDHATQVRLAKAAQNGQMQALPVEKRGQLIQAVQNGDMNAIHNIMNAVEKAVPDTSGRTPQGGRVDQAVLNKAAIIIKYARDTHLPDISGISSVAARQQIADGAIAHAIREGHWEQYANKTATYRGGISDSSMKIIGDALNFLDGKP